MDQNDLTRVRENLGYLSPKNAKIFLSKHDHSLLTKTRVPSKILDITKYMDEFDDYAFNKTLRAINDYPIKTTSYQYRGWKEDILNMKFNKEQKDKVMSAFILKELS